MTAGVVRWLRLQVKGGTPTPIPIFAKSFNPTAQAWSTFEREFCGIRDALKATEHLTKGFPVVLYTDHKNNLFNDALKASLRINKKLLRWATEVEELSGRGEKGLDQGSR